MAGASASNVNLCPSAHAVSIGSLTPIRLDPYAYGIYAVSIGIYTFMLAWNEFLFALTLTRTNDMRTVPICIQLLMGQHSYERDQVLAMSVLGCLSVLILFLFFQRYFIAGMSAGSVKG